MTQASADVLRDVFGFDAFRGDQQDIVDHVVGGGDALVLMPTGGGKSLCYQVPALVRPGTAIVISPLIALMHDQVTALRQLGVRAAYLNSSLTPAKAREVEEWLAAGELDLLYVAPERLLTDRFMTLLERAQIALFAIDEAHCVSMWGHDFRPEYRQLRVLHERFPGVPRIALTATADEPTRADIAEHLDLRGARSFIASFDRPNIRYTVQLKNSPQRQLLAFLESHKGDSGIVYRLSRRNVEETAQALRDAGYDAIAYHAGMDNNSRRANQARFIKEEGVIVVATIAFGMGIDKPDVRFVAHLDLPKSVEGYYQETGRAGRDGLASDAWLVYSTQDIVSMRRMIDDGEAGDERKRVERQKLDQLVGYCESTECRRKVLLAHFGEPHGGSCGNCDTCITPPNTWDGTVAAQKALSCAIRTDERYGAGHLTDVLIGKRTDKVERAGHDRVTTFGIGTELNESQWRGVFRQLVAMGMLHADPARKGGLRVTDAGRPVLRGEQPVTFREEVATKKVRTAKRETVDLSGDDLALFERLRARRAALASEQGVPPYVVFHDSTLLEMVRSKPSTLDEMSRISGVGLAKLERYGEIFLAALTG